MSDLQVGTWRCRAVNGSQQFGTASSGTEQIAVAIEFTDGPNKGRRTAWYGSFTEKTEDRTLEALRYLGWSNDDIFAMEGLGSLEAEAVLEEETGQDGKTRVRVRWINRARGPSFKNPIAGDQLKAFSARLKGKALAKRLDLERNGIIPPADSPARTAVSASSHEAPPHTDADDPLPF
jgi:hypothetical protein